MQAKTIGVVFSCFDLLHPGHVLFLEQARNQCDYLIAGLQVDPAIERPFKNKPIQTLFERYLQLEAVKYVDEIIPYVYESEIDQILKSFLPAKRFLGHDYADTDPEKITGWKTCREIGTEIIFVPRSHDFSSTELRKRIKG